jgi:hypothetical protein
MPSTYERGSLGAIGAAVFASDAGPPSWPGLDPAIRVFDPATMRLDLAAQSSQIV